MLRRSSLTFFHSTVVRSARQPPAYFVDFVAAFNKRFDESNASFNKKLDDNSASFNKKLDDNSASFNKKLDDTSAAINKKLDDNSAAFTKRLDALEAGQQALRKKIDAFEDFVKASGNYHKLFYGAGAIFVLAAAVLQKIIVEQSAFNGRVESSAAHSVAILGGLMSGDIVAERVKANQRAKNGVMADKDALHAAAENVGLAMK